MRSMRRAGMLLGLLGLSIVLGVGTRVDAQSITWTGRPSNSNDFGYLFYVNLGNISKDGSRLVQITSDPYAYMWDRSLGWQLIGGYMHRCYDISDNGNIAAGFAPTQYSHMPALYYRASTAWQPLGLPSGFDSGAAVCISRDGNTVAGWLGVNSPGTAACPFLYRGGVYTLLPIPAGSPPFTAVSAVGISPEGEVVVGHAGYDPSDGRVLIHALRWDLEGLTTLPKPTPNWGAWAVDASEAGEVIVGGGQENGVYKPLIWRNSSVAILPTGSFVHGVAHRTTQTGQVITGTAFGATWYAAWAVRWGPCGFENLNTVYAHLLGANEILLTAHALSRSGRYIAGLSSRDGGNTIEMYVLDTNRCWDPAGNVNANCCVDDADLLQVLFDFGNTGTGRPTDLNCDGIVDDADLLIVLFNFGQGCPG